MDGPRGAVRQGVHPPERRVSFPPPPRFAATQAERVSLKRGAVRVNMDSSRSPPRPPVISAGSHLRWMIILGPLYIGATFHTLFVL